MQPETAERWLDAQIVEATGQWLPQDGEYWDAGREWIAAEHTARRQPAGM